LGNCYEYGKLGCKPSPRESIRYYTAGAHNNDPEAQFALAGWYLTGAADVIDQNDDESYYWVEKAAQQELPRAEYAMG